MAASDIQRDDVLKAIEYFDDPGNDQRVRSLRFGSATKYRLVYEGRFYNSKTIAGIAHGIATGRFWNSDDLSGGVSSGAGADILRDLGFVVDDGPLSELEKLKVYRNGEMVAPYQHVVLLWAISRARSGAPRWVDLSSVYEELADLLKPFQIANNTPDPATPWMALLKSSWWHDASLDDARGGGAEYDPDVDNHEDIPESEEGLSESIYERVTTDDKFAGAAVDVMSRIIGDRPAFDGLLDRLGLAQLSSITGSVSTSSALHLLLRWDPSRNTETIADHRTIAESKGAVWWGKVGDLSKNAVSEINRQTLDDQLHAGTPTHVYLSGAGQLWRTTLEALASDDEEVDPALVPSYYDPATSHHLWLKLSQFQQLPPQWITQHLILASNGKPVNFGGQSSLFYVRETAETAHLSTHLVPEPRALKPFDGRTLAEAAEAAELLLDPSVTAAIVAALNSGKNIILTGPPGTAKTTLAEVTARLAKSAGLCAGYKLTTATADWTTYDTIGGLSPAAEGQGLEFRQGHFLEAIASREWLIIDELNRSNFDRAFGQLFTILSGQSVVLPYRDPESGKPLAVVHEAQHDADARETYAATDYAILRVPNSWRIVATMNVFDKSLLFEMSFALMRRFAFIEVPAPPDDVFRSLWSSRIVDLDQGSAAVIDATLDGLLMLRKIKEIGPAVFIDMARFAVKFVESKPTAEQLAYQLFYSFLLPQFEGVDRKAGQQLFAAMSRLVGSGLRVKLLNTLNEVLGLSMTTTVAPVSIVGEEDLSPSE